MKYIVFTLILFQNCIANFFNKDKLSEEAKIEVHFQDFFKDDFISLTINNLEIITNEKLFSEPSTGFTGLVIKITKDNVFLVINNKVLKKNKFEINQSFFLKIRLNNKEHLYEINISHGKYIGFSKKTGDNLDFIQTEKKFIYD